MDQAGVRQSGTPHEEPVISVSHLHVGYGDGDVLQDVSFDIHQGEIFFIVGESGCGKSTLMKHIVGLYPARSGRITVCGVDITNATDSQMEEVRARIGILFQGGALLGSLTVRENVELPLLRHPEITPDLLQSIVRIKLDMVNLPGYENHLPSELSGGLRNRIGLARAFALDPAVVFLDEPTSGLDPMNAREIDELIRKFNHAIGTTMVIVSQDIRSVLSIAHRVLLLDKNTKRVSALGTPAELAHDPPTELAARFFEGIAA